MVDPSMIVVDPPPLTSDFGCGLSIPPFDNIFLSQQLSRDDGALGDNQNDMVSLEDLLDFDMDSSLEDLCLPSSDLEELLDSTQFQQPDSTQFQQPDSNFLQFFSDFNQFGDHVIFEPADAEPRNYSGEGALSGDHNSNGSGVLSSLSPGMDSNYITDLNVKSPESNGSNLGISEKCDGAANGINCPSPESQGSGNRRSNVSLESNNPLPRSVSSSPDSSNSSIKVGTIDKNIKLDDFPKNSKGRFSLLKRKKEGDELVTNNNVEFRISKFRKSTCDTENKVGSHDNCGLSEEEKRKARLMRNRESAQLSRQRKKHYVDELEDKVKSMNATIQDLNMKISYFMAENATLRQHMGGAVGVSPPPMGPPAPGIYPHPAMMYPWMPPYMVKPLGSQVPLVPIPRLKQQQPAQAPKVSKKVDKKNEGRKTKKVASVSFLGLLFFIMLFGGLVPMVNMRYGGVQEAFTGRDNYVGGGSYGNHHGRVLMVNETDYGGRRDLTGNSSLHCGIGGEPSPNEFLRCNGSQPLTASLYVPRNDKLVKIDGNLIIHSVMASDKAMASHGKEGGETGLAVRGDLSPAIPSVARNGARHPPLRALGSVSAGKDATDGKIQEWFRESLGGPMLTSGMCTEVFQFDVSSSLVPATSRNISEEQTHNSTQLGPQRNRRILYDHPIPIPVSSRDISRERAGINSQGNNLNVNKNTSSMVVSVLVDPRDTSDADIDGVLGTKSLSRIFVVVLIDSVKYVTYSCMLPFKASTATHLVTTRGWNKN